MDQKSSSVWVAADHRWLSYGIAVGGVAVTALVLSLTGLDEARELLVLPILLAAYLGGRRPGLVATGAVAVAVIAGHAPRTAFDAVQLAGMIAVGAIMSLVIEALHEARRAEQAREHAYDRSREVALQREAQLRELAESIHEVFWLTDPGCTRTLYVSPAYAKIFGRPTTTVYANARDWLELVHPEDLARITNLLDGGDPAPCSHRYRIIRDDGTPRTLQINAFPVHDAGGQLVRIAGVTEDITERLALEEQVRQTQKLESLGLLAGGVAHDFNNILAVIGASVGLLAEGSHTESDRELIDEIEKAVGRASALTRQLLAFSHKQVTEPIVLDLNAAIGETRRMLRRMVGEDIVIETSLEPELAHVRIDPGHLVQVVMNLAVNARDAMASGGRLRLTTRNAMGPAGREVVLWVADTGCGMTAEVRERAFEALFTTKGIGRGTGLGLSVVQRIIQDAGGRIEVHSEPGAGAEFEIHLPAIDAPVQILPELTGAAAHGVERIVVVDDDLYVRATASRALRARGYTVLEAGDANAALRILRDQGDRVALLVTDVVMPGMDGRELAEQARRERPELRVLYTSGYADDAELRHGVDRSEVAFLEKPFRVRALAGKVRQVLDA